MVSYFSQFPHIFDGFKLMVNSLVSYIMGSVALGIICCRFAVNDADRNENDDDL